MRLLVSASILCWASRATAVTVKVSSYGAKDASRLQYGLMFEDINYSGDGGIYAELIQNRALQGDEITPATIHPWEAFGPSNISLEDSSQDHPPLSPALTKHLTVTAGKPEVEIGVSNPGYWGIDVLPETYTGSFWVYGDYQGEFEAALRSSRTGDIYAATSVASKSKADEWTEHNFKLTPEYEAGHEANFTLTFLSPSEGHQLHFNLISLFPPTYKDRANGLRRDLIQSLKDLNPSFLRMPGGNNIQGNLPDSQWRWNSTLGDLTERPGRTGAWGYYNTDGLGLIEYMLLCQDLETEPILVVFAGLYLGGTVISESELGGYIQDALNEVEFLIGDASTKYGALRASLGYPEPFRLRYIEVGNEDHFSGGLDSYNNYRFRMFYDAIRETYPSLTILSSTIELSSPIPEGVSLDYHDYGNPDGAVRNFTLFDNHNKNNKVLVGEYGVARDNGNDVLWENHRARPWWIASVAEAIFYLGVERNPERVYGVAYAPLLQNVNSYQWAPNLISFNANTSATTRSTSYHVLRLFSQNRVTKILSDSCTNDDFGPGYWVAGINEDTGIYVWKGAVYNSTSAQEFNVVFPRTPKKGEKATLRVLKAPDAFSENLFGESSVVESEISELSVKRDGISFALPQWSVAILEWKFK